MTVFIHVSDGRVGSVNGNNDYHVIDWDSLEYGYCPICDNYLIGDGLLYCDNCYVDWKGIAYNETLAEIAIVSNSLRHRKQMIFNLIEKEKQNEG
jgi:hypothetical protein